MQTTTTDDKTVSQLNSFLRGELSAVDTYKQAIEKVEDKPRVRSTLEDCLSSHETRAAALSQQIDALGGTPANSSGPWGALAKMAEGGAKLFGAKAAVEVLEEGEDHGLKDYRQDLDNLNPQMRAFVQESLLPEQKQTHDALSRLQNEL